MVPALASAAVTISFECSQKSPINRSSCGMIERKARRNMFVRLDTVIQPNLVTPLATRAPACPSVSSAVLATSLRECNPPFADHMVCLRR